jgi:hypothetical protein
LVCLLPGDIGTNELICKNSGYNATSTSSYSKTVVPTGSYTTTKPPTVPTAGANKAIAVSGGALAGLLGLAAFVL